MRNAKSTITPESQSFLKWINPFQLLRVSVVYGTRSVNIKFSCSHFRPTDTRVNANESASLAWKLAQPLARFHGENNYFSIDFSCCFTEGAVSLKSVDSVLLWFHGIPWKTTAAAPSDENDTYIVRWMGVGNRSFSSLNTGRMQQYDMFTKFEWFQSDQR